MQMPQLVAGDKPKVLSEADVNEARHGRGDFYLLQVEAVGAINEVGDTLLRDFEVSDQLLSIGRIRRRGKYFCGLKASLGGIIHNAIDQPDIEAAVLEGPGGYYVLPPAPLDSGLEFRRRGSRSCHEMLDAFGDRPVLQTWPLMKVVVGKTVKHICKHLARLLDIVNISCKIDM